MDIFVGFGVPILTGERLIQVNDPLPPVRGLIPLHNAKGKPYPIRDIHRWIRFLRQELKVEKIDLAVQGKISFVAHALLHYYSKGDTLWMPNCPHHVPIVNLSLRTDCPEPPYWLQGTKWLKLFDVFLTPTSVNNPNLTAWLELCRREELAARLQIQPPFPEAFDTEGFCANAVNCGVTSVNIVLNDPFVTPAPKHVSVQSYETTLSQIHALAYGFANRGVEVNLYDIPLCHVAPDLRDCAGGRSRYFLDHQQYHRKAYRLAQMLYQYHPRLAGLALMFLSIRNHSYRPPTDAHLIHWLMVNQHKSLYSLLLLLSKTVRRRGWFPGETELLEDREHAYLDEVVMEAEAAEKKMNAACRSCALRRTCDGETPLVRRYLPGLHVLPEKAERILSPRASLCRQSKYYDPIDNMRLQQEREWQDLAHEAAAVMSNRLPTPLSIEKIIIDKTFYTKMPGAYRYYGFEDREHLSTLAFWGEIPFTLAATFGGGMAELAGFCLWDSIRLVCPMIAPSHQIVLHASADGRYVLLRDGQPVRPAEFRGKYFVPRRMPTYVQIKLSLWDIQGDICLQNLQEWRGEQDLSRKDKVKYSFLVVSTRFARRLQAVLQGIAHQRGIDPEEVEVIVGYVPGLDATEDVLSSIRLAFPNLRVLHAPFPENAAHAKGFIINRSVSMASGEWVILIDSDIVVAPDMCSQLAKVPESAIIAAPVGRKMLPPDITGRILLGELRPWEDWDCVVAGPGENRFGEKREGGEIPVGFCQCVRKSCFQEIRYNEYEHFEGADWEFAAAIVEKHGRCVWLESPVLHLDHGGSQWFGTRTHR